MQLITRILYLKMFVTFFRRVQRSVKHRHDRPEWDFIPRQTFRSISSTSMFLCNGDELFAAFYSKLQAESRFFRSPGSCRIYSANEPLKRSIESPPRKLVDLCWSCSCGNRALTRSPRTGSKRSLANEPFWTTHVRQFEDVLHIVHYATAMIPSQFRVYCEMIVMPTEREFKESRGLGTK